MKLSLRGNTWTEKATSRQTSEARAYRVAQGRAREVQFRVIYQDREEYEVQAMGHFFGVSRAASYKWVKHWVEPDKHTERMLLVREAWLKSRKT